MKNAFLCAVVLVLSCGFAVGRVTERVLYNFSNTLEGADPQAALIFDDSGNLYGTTPYGGMYGYGTVFELTPNQDGSWTENVLYSFMDGSDGADPVCNLIFDAAGNIYGTTQSGGDAPFPDGDGVVFKLTPSDNGGWTETVIRSFEGRTDASHPASGLVFDPAGNLYGTTVLGGTQGYGTVFELTPNQDGSWTEAVLHSFKGGNDGSGPLGSLVIDGSGNLYGTTASGGPKLAGTVFKLSPAGGGVWNGSLLHTFTGGNDGAYPTGALTFDADGNLYGATREGAIPNCGDGGCGVIFKLTPSLGEGRWNTFALHTFTNYGGFHPNGSLVFDAVGNLYGTTQLATGFLNGTVFRLSRRKNGGMAIVTYSFNGEDGNTPYAGVILDSKGRVYGTTDLGGSGYGVVFRITP